MYTARSQEYDNTRAFIYSVLCLHFFRISTYKTNFDAEIKGNSHALLTTLNQSLDHYKIVDLTDCKETIQAISP